MVVVVVGYLSRYQQPQGHTDEWRLSGAKGTTGDVDIHNAVFVSRVEGKAIQVPP